MISAFGWPQLDWSVAAAHVHWLPSMLQSLAQSVGLSLDSRPFWVNFAGSFAAVAIRLLVDWVWSDGGRAGDGNAVDGGQLRAVAFHLDCAGYGLWLDGSSFGVGSADAADCGEDGGCDEEAGVHGSLSYGTVSLGHFDLTLIPED